MKSASYKIKECTSEDPVHPVSNLQNPDLYRMWQTNGYIKKAFVDLVFPEPIQIKTIDIGNAGSAFVEILVAKSEDIQKPKDKDADKDAYVVLVPINSMMSLQDIKSNTNRGRTKRFEKFTAAVSDSKWDTVRVICTQPFSDKNPIGLSYLFVNSKTNFPLGSTSPGPSSQTSKSPSKNNNSNNNNNEDADTDVDEDVPKTNSAESMKRENSALIKKLHNDVKQKAKHHDEDVESLLDKNDKKPNKHQIRDDSDEEQENKPKQPKSSLIIKPKNKDAPPSNKSNDKSPDNKSDNKKAADKPMNTILKGVVFAISGIMNPERGEIREKGTELGAVYKRDWDDDCTHLICKFANTPKYNEVKGKGGIIATPQWILDCNAKARKLKLTKKYTLEEDQPKLSSDSTDEKKKKKKKKKTGSTDPTKGYDSDSNDDDDGKPNEYDYNDSFIDNAGADSDDGDFVPRRDDDEEESEASEEDFDELMKESKAFIKKNGGVKKRSRDSDNGSDDEEDERHKKQKSHHNSHHHNEGKTFSKQHNSNNNNNNNNNNNKHQSDKKPHNAHKRNSDSDNEQYQKKPKHDVKPKVRRDESGSGTEGMSDDDVKQKFSRMVFPDEPAENPTKKSKSNKNKQKIPNDDSGSGTEGMNDVDIKKTGVYHSDESDSDITQPLDHVDLKNVLGALGAGSSGGYEATQLVDGDTNWQELVTKKFDEKAKEKEALGKTYPINELPSFLAPVQAFFSGVGRKNELKLHRYIIAYNGKIDEYLGDETKYIFTEKSWDRNFDDALKLNSDLTFVKPDWIFACHSKQKLVDIAPYRITKQK